MSFRDILVQVDESPQSAIRTEVAAALAARSDARLTGLFLKSSFIKQFLAAVPFSYLPPADLEALIDQHTAAVNSAAEATRANFEQVARDAGVIAEWLSVDGELDGVVERCARQFDLTVLPPEFKLASSHRQISADHVALASGGPVLILPDRTPNPCLGTKVLVAWNSSRESARALRDAWPLIRVAQVVEVLIVSPESERDVSSRGLLKRHFARHGCRANIVVERSDEATAAQVIRRHVSDLDADLVVMGCYGRPRLQELVLGGVSRDLMRDPPAALLVSH